MMRIPSNKRRSFALGFGALSLLAVFLLQRELAPSTTLDLVSDLAPTVGEQAVADDSRASRFRVTFAPEVPEIVRETIRTDVTVVLQRPAEWSVDEQMRAGIRGTKPGVRIPDALLLMGVASGLEVRASADLVRAYQTALEPVKRLEERRGALLRMIADLRSGSGHGVSKNWRLSDKGIDNNLALFESGAVKLFQPATVELDLDAGLARLISESEFGFTTMVATEDDSGTWSLAL